MPHDAGERETFELPQVLIAKGAWSFPICRELPESVGPIANPPPTRGTKPTHSRASLIDELHAMLSLS